MRRTIWPICATLLLAGTFRAAPGRAQSEGTGLAPLGSRGGSGEADAAPRLAGPSAAERAVWDFVHFGAPAELVDVIDAFDDEDPFDLNLSVGYIRTLRRAKIGRECRNPDLCFPRSIRDDGAGREFIDTTDVMRYTQETHILDMLLTVGLYHDLNVYFRCPLILLDTRSLTVEEGVQPTVAEGILGGLFDLPFESPDRSGVDYFSFGMSWAPFNQERDPTEPNWVLNFEGRFGVGELLRAARSDGDGGISRGVNEIRFAMFLSRRFRWLEPYAGLTAMIGIPKYDTGHHFKDPLDGQINTMPPIEGTLLAGLEIVPWENLDRFQKLSLGIEISATFHSEGRTFSEMFDALGTSDDPRLTYSDATDRFSTNWRDRFSGHAYGWDGMTDVENYATFAGRFTFMIQPAKYVKFLLGVGFAHDQEHFITYTDECNSEVTGSCIDYNDNGTPGDPSDDRYVFGDQYNPMTRDVIDAPGNRFRAQETTVFDVFLSVVAMF